MPDPRDAAVIGVGCIFPGAPDAETYWNNIQGGVDAISDVPAARWDPVFYDPTSSAVDRFYCKRGGFVDDFATFDSLGFGIMPVAAQGAEPDQLIALEVASRALKDAGYADRDFPRERCGVILGRGNYIGAGMTRLEQHVRTAQQLVECLRTLVPGITETQLGAVKAEFQSRLGGYGPDTAIGLVPNLTASRIANRLDLYGPAYTVDAACASSLVATDHACRDLREGRSDMVLCGGVHLSHDVAFWSVFCQLGALSRTQQIRPFDANADGILIGEGVGIVVLKRYEDAERDGDRIYAVIRGTGIASDGREASLMVPRVEGQLFALQRAWKQAGANPAGLSLIEAHGTGTPVGDGAELETLTRFFGTEGSRVGLGSVKSMIGHAMPAAGAAGLIKTVLALHHRVLPPSLHCEEPHPLLVGSRFGVLSRAQAWTAQNGSPLLAGVNAFGFGGINGHVVLESTPGSGSAPALGPRPVLTGDQPEEMLLLAAGSPEALARALDAGVETPGDGPCRLALVNPTAERRSRARDVVLKGRPRAGRDGLWFSPEGIITRGGGVALLFPGVEAVFAPRVHDVAKHFGKVLPRLDQGTALERQGAGIVAVGRMLHSVLADVGIRADLMCGHSVGEWTGMICAEMIPTSALDGLLGSLTPGSLEVPGVVFAACGGSAERVGVLIEDLDDVVITHDNCPHQIILCGPETGVDKALTRMKDARILAQKLPFRSGFHSPLFSDFLAPHAARFRALGLAATQTPLWSATTCEPYPADPEAIRVLAERHLVEPVRFRELVQTLWEQGTRAFVQVGTGSLVGFVSDTLRKKPHLAMSTTVDQRSGMNQLRRLLAALYVEGADVDWARFATGHGTPSRSRLKLQLGVPLVQLDTPLDGRVLPTRVPTGAHPVAREFDALMNDFGRLQTDILDAWQAPTASARPKPKAAELTIERRLSVVLEPTLLDHCLLPQPEDWEVVSDRNPVVPMTMSIRMMLDAAEKLVPGWRAVGLEHLRAYKWLQVQPEVEISVDAVYDGGDRVKVAIKGFSEATVLVAPDYPAAPAPRAHIAEARDTVPITAGQLYSDRWMFHGPAYQGVTDLAALTDEGIRGTLKGLAAEGGLLDNAGQLFGFWVMIKTTADRLAMPIRVKKLELFGPEPAADTPVECSVWTGRLGPKEVDCHMQLTVGGKLWARITGWSDWRFETDDRLWPVMHRTEDNLFCDVTEYGFTMLVDPDRSDASRDYLAARYLTQRERDIYEQLAASRKTGWLYGRIAAKDAARHFLTTRSGRGPMFPVEIAVGNDDNGRPVLTGRFEQDLRVSIAHKNDIAVAIVAEGRDVGIDVERIESRSARFASLACTEAERALLPTEDWDAWLTRFWSAKEVYGKMRGTGLEGNPKQFVITHVDGERLRIADCWVETRQQGDYILAWTPND